MRKNTTAGVSSHPVKHPPQRTCVACRKVRNKQELIRLTRISADNIEVDVAGKKTGRGAYLCPAKECWKAAFKDGRLERTLRVTLTPDKREEIIKYGESLWREPSGWGK